MEKGNSTILVVDDESGVRRLLRRALEREGFTVLEATNGAEMYQQLESTKVDLITLDLSLGQENGLELARVIRQNSTLPIIMVSGKGELIDTVVGLEIGANDYISKPFELREVVARIRAVLRTYKSSSSLKETEHLDEKNKLIRFLDWTLDPSVRELRDSQGAICELTTGEYDMLHLLVTHPRQVLSRDDIMNHLKGNTWSANDRTIDNQIARLRKKLQSSGSDEKLIKTIRGAGYLFTPDVTSIAV